MSRKKFTKKKKRKSKIVASDTCKGDPRKPSATALHAGEYYCLECRYRPCSAEGCNVARPVQARSGLPRSEYSVFNKSIWYCDNCVLTNKNVCKNVSNNTCKGDPRKPSATALHAGEYYCLGCRYPPCSTEGCKERRPVRAQSGESLTQYSVFNKPTWFCKGCKNKKTRSSVLPNQLRRHSFAGFF